MGCETCTAAGCEYCHSTSINSGLCASPEYAASAADTCTSFGGSGFESDCSLAVAPTCDAQNDKCNFKFDTICDQGYPVSTPNCFAADCLDCDPCMQNNESCQSCTTAGCMFCSTGLHNLCISAENSAAVPDACVQYGGLGVFSSSCVNGTPQSSLPATSSNAPAPMPQSATNKGIQESAGTTNNNGLGSSIIIVIVVAATVFVLAVVGLVVLLNRRKNIRRKASNDVNEGTESTTHQATPPIAEFETTNPAIVQSATRNVPSALSSANTQRAVVTSYEYVPTFKDQSGTVIGTALVATVVRADSEGKTHTSTSSSAHRPPQLDP
jgi:hypothetical protein